MVTREQIRRQKLAELCADKGSAAEVARLTGVAPNMVQRVVRGDPGRNLGARLARRIEKACGKPVNWLDTLDLSPDALDVASKWDRLLEEDKAVIRRIIVSSGPVSTEMAHPLQTANPDTAATQREAEIRNERLKIEQQADLELTRAQAHHPPRAKNHGTPDTGVPGTRKGRAKTRTTAGRKKARNVRN